MKYYIVIKTSIFFGLIPWTSTRRANNREHAAKLLATEVGAKVHPTDIPRLVGKQFIIQGRKTITVFQ